MKKDQASSDKSDEYNFLENKLNAGNSSNQHNVKRNLIDRFILKLVSQNRHYNLNDRYTSIVIKNEDENICDRGCAARIYISRRTTY